jgi:hypothetical protein
MKTHLKARQRVTVDNDLRLPIIATSHVTDDLERCWLYWDRNVSRTVGLEKSYKPRHNVSFKDCLDTVVLNTFAE